MVDKRENKKPKIGIDKEVKAPISPRISVDVNAIIAKLLSSDIEEVSEEDFGSMDHAFSNGELLYIDVLNFWSHLNMPFKIKNPKVLLENLNNLKPLLHYRQSFESMSEAYENLTTRAECEKDLKRIMELSDPVQIQAYNELVDEFNADLERIKREKDFSILDNYYQRASTLVKKKDE